jgi:hypothetical protein
VYLRVGSIAAERITLFVDTTHVIAARRNEQGLAAGMAALAPQADYPADVAP